MSSLEEDPKEAAKQARRLPETEKAMRQFLNIDGPKGVTESYRENYDLVFRGEDCSHCKRRFLKTQLKAEKIIKDGKETDGFLCAECFVP